MRQWGMTRERTHHMVTDTLFDLIAARATTTPQRVAFTFLQSGVPGRDELRITYAELDQQARRIASLLLAQAAPGGRALLLYAPGLEYILGFFGAVYAGII